MVTQKSQLKEQQSGTSNGQAKKPAGGYKKLNIPWGWIIGCAVGALVIGNLIEAKLFAVRPLPVGLIQTNGRIEGDHVMISSKFSGRLGLLAVREGDTVKAGQLLMKVEDPQTNARRDQAAASLTSAIAEEQSLGSTVDLTKQTGSALILQAQGQLAQAESAIDSAKADSLRAGAGVESARAALSDADQSVVGAQSGSDTARANRSRAAAALDDAKAGLAGAQAGLYSAQANADSAKAASEQATRQAGRYSGLAAQGAVSQEVAENMQTAAAQAQKQYDAAAHQVDAASANVDSKTTELSSAEQNIKIADSGIRQADSQLSSAKARVTAARAAVRQALALQTSAQQSVRQAFARRNQAQGQLNQAMTAPTQVKVSERNRSSGEARIKLARSSLQEVQSMIDEMSVKSPISGTVVTRFQDQGEMVSPGSPVLELVNLDRLYLKVYVQEQDIGKIKLGLPAMVYTDAFPNQPFPAKIGYISSQAEFTPKEIQTATERVSLMYAVELYFESNPNHELNPGMQADAVIRWKEGVQWQRPR